MTPLARELVDKMSELSFMKNGDVALSHAQLNQPDVHQTIVDLLSNRSDRDSSESAIVIGAGPSLHIKNSVAQILDSEYDGTTICADSALAHCLWNGLVPDYVVTVDPIARIVRWFGDPDLSSIDQGDDLARQDTDTYLGADEIARNQERIDLIDKYAPNIKAIISTSVHQTVTRRCIESGMDLFWWNPLYDDFETPESLTKKVFGMNKVPCMVSGGNSGTSAWVFAHAVLQKKHVALVGIDFGYEPGTPIEKTRYYEHAAELFGDRAEDIFIDVHNPYLKTAWFPDPAFYWYRQSFLQMARLADCTTYNCTEGGILFGKGVRFSPLREFLATHSNESD